MDTSQLVNQMVAGIVADKMKAMDKKPDANMLAMYTKSYPEIAGILSDPKALMALIDKVHQREARNSPGTPADLFQAQRANNALTDIHGINAYTPQGFLAENKNIAQEVPGASIFQDPRPAPGDFLTGPHGQKIR